MPFRGATLYEKIVARQRRPLESSPADPLPELVRYATLAANSHNTQPWLFRRTPEGLEIAPDYARRTPVVDPDDHHLFASLGCAAENVLIAAPSLGRAGAFRFNVERKMVTLGLESRMTGDDPLVAAILRRQSTRSEYDGREVPSDALAQLQAAGQVDGVELRLLTSRTAIDGIRDYVVDGTRQQVADAAFSRELKRWLRFNSRAAVTTADGLYSACFGRPNSATCLGRMIFDFLFTEAAETKRYIAQMNSSAGVAVIISAAADPAHWVQAGRSYQRFALQATALGIKHAFVNQPVEVPAVRGQLASHLGIGDRRPDLVIRFGSAADKPFSLRRSVDQVLSG